MPTFRVTEKGTTTIMHASEVRKLHAVHHMVTALERNQPMLKAYGDCATALEPICELWPLPEEAEKTNDKPGV